MQAAVDLWPHRAESVDAQVAPVFEGHRTTGDQLLLDAGEQLAERGLARGEQHVRMVALRHTAPWHRIGRQDCPGREW